MLTVVKYGGNAIEDQQSLIEFARQIKRFIERREQVVIVHGGGPQINALSEKLGVKSHFVNGQRYTDEATLRVVEYALCAEVNKALVRALAGEGLEAVGISGQDGGLLKALPQKDLGAVGTIAAVNPKVIEALLNAGFIPVIAPLALGENQEVLNINADFSAGKIAEALHADQFLLLSNVKGILNADKKRFPQLSLNEMNDLIADGTISGGMIPKVECLKEALLGAKCAYILHAEDLGLFLNGELTGTKVFI